MKAIVVGLAAAFVFVGSASASHGHVTTFIVRTRGAGPIGIPETPGQPARLKLDLLDASPPDAMQGELRHNAVIAAYAVRAADAIVLDASVPATGRLLPAGLALARVDTTEASGAKAVLWCDARRRAVFESLYSVDCLQDDGTGALRLRWTGHLFAWKDSLGVGSAKLDPTPLPAGTPTPHHEARATERPTGRIGYGYCDGDNVSGPPRFTTAVSIGPDGGWINGMPYTCTLGAWPVDGDHSVVQVDAIRLKVLARSPLSYTVIQGLPNRQILTAAAGHPLLFEPSPSVATAAGPPPVPPTVRKGVHVLEPMGAPSLVAFGTVAPGAELFHIPARHGITGVLLNSVSYSGLFGGHTIPAGHAVYGVPMTNASAGRPAIVWCALDTNGLGFTFSSCFPHDGFAYRWIDVPGPFASSFVWSASSLQASAPSVKVTLEDIKTSLEVSYRFVGWRKDGVATVRMSVTAGPKSQSDQTLRLFPLPDVGVVLDVFSTRLSLHPAPDGKGALVAPAATTETTALASP